MTAQRSCMKYALLMVIITLLFLDFCASLIVGRCQIIDEYLVCALVTER